MPVEDQVLEALGDCQKKQADLIGKVETLRAENATLRETLQRYGVHDDGCIGRARPNECTCGLTDWQRIQEERDGCVDGHIWEPLPRESSLVEHDEVCSKCGVERDFTDRQGDHDGP